MFVVTSHTPLTSWMGEKPPSCPCPSKLRTCRSSTVHLTMVWTPPCLLVTAGESSSLLVVPIEGKRPPLGPIVVVATSPQPVAAIERLPPWPTSPQPLELRLVP